MNLRRWWESALNVEDELFLEIVLKGFICKVINPQMNVSDKHVESKWFVIDAVISSVNDLAF